MLINPNDLKYKLDISTIASDVLYNTQCDSTKSYRQTNSREDYTEETGGNTGDSGSSWQLLSSAYVIGAGLD